MIVGQLGFVVVGFADTLMVGRYSTDALAAASFVNNIMTLVIVSLMGFSYGITPIVSALAAQRNFSKIGSRMRDAAFANMLFSGSLMLVLVVLYFYLDRMGQPEHLLPLVRPYYIVSWISLAFVAAFNILRQFADGLSEPSIGMWLLIGGNIFNIVFNYFLIYGACGFPELGLLGAGISTLAARVLMAVAFICIVLQIKRFRTSVESFSASRTQSAGIRSIFKISLPISLQSGMETGSFTFSCVMVGWIGAAQLASYQVMVTVGMLGFMFYYGIGAATAIKVAGYAGLGDVGNLRRSAFASHIILLFMALGASLIFYFFADPLIGIFTADKEVIAISKTLIVPLILYQFGDATQVCYANALRGTSHVYSMMWIAFVSYMAVGLPTGYVLAFVVGLGEVGVFLSFTVSLFLAGALFFARFLHHSRP